jgi:hypothetical protein
MLTLMPMCPDVGAQTRTARTGVPARYTGSGGPGTLVTIAVPFPVKRSTILRSTGSGVRPAALKSR